MVQLFPESVAKLWNEWDIRVMVLGSLCIQILLIIFGSRRKYNAKIWIRIVTWIAYLSADWVATVALGMISSFQGDRKKNSPHPNNQIMALWAPFLLVHLGGPDTITAYSTEDNELWLRHLLGLLVQVGVGLYIFLRSWTSSMHNLSLIAIPIHVAGIIKYGERTWVLRSASTGRFRDSLLLAVPNPGPDHYANFTGDTKSQGERLDFSIPNHNYADSDSEDNSLESQQDPRRESHFAEGSGSLAVSPITTEPRHLREGYELFNKIFKYVYADLVLDEHARDYCDHVLRHHSFHDAFKLIEIELGYMYDVLYTKASILYSLPGIIFRSISLLCCASTLVAFCLIIDKKLYSSIDIIVTYLLSVGSIFLELYAILVLVSTDRTLCLLREQNHWLASSIYQAISSFRPILSNDKRWSGYMARFNLIDFCLKEKPSRCARIQRIFGIDEMLDKYWHTTSEDVPIELKQLIFEQLQNAKRKSGNNFNGPLNWDGFHAVENNRDEYAMGKISWFLDKQLDEKILLLHIATDICYYRDFHKHQVASNHYSKAKLSKLVSDYMLYILVMRPFMLPEGIGHILFRDTCTEATTSFEMERNVEKKGKSYREMVIESFNDIEKLLGRYKNGQGKVEVEVTALLPGAFYLVTSLEGHHNRSDKHLRWKFISEMWIELLCYAASQCGWNQHGQQLRRGGELLSHVSLLMTNLGISKNFRDPNSSDSFDSD